MATQLHNDSLERLKYQTWVLGVSIHCKGCEKEVKKVLHSIDGVFTVSVDPQQHKATVTGNVEVEKLIKKLAKSGKHAEILHENVYENEDDSGKSKSNEKENDSDNGEKAGDGGDDPENISEGKDENFPKISNENAAENGKPDQTICHDGKKKKKKKKKGAKRGNNLEGARAEGETTSTGSPTAAETVDPPIGLMHLGPPAGHVYPFPTPYYPASGVGLSFSTSHPSGSSSYYALPMHGYTQPRTNYLHPPPSDPFHAYSSHHGDDIYVENDDGGCPIM